MIGFAAWAEKHCTVFGMFDPKHVQMVASWQPLFDAAGYASADLDEATQWLALHAPPKFPNEHLDAIRRRLMETRAVKRRGGQEDADRGDCGLCGGAGRVIVPHRGGVENGQWKPQAGSARPHHYTEAVACHCSRGRFGNWTAPDRTGRAKVVTMLTLAEYERINPLWRRQMAARDREFAELGRLTEMSPVIRAVLNRHLRQTRQPGEDDE